MVMIPGFPGGLAVIIYPADFISPRAVIREEFLKTLNTVAVFIDCSCTPGVNRGILVVALCGQFRIVAGVVFQVPIPDMGDFFQTKPHKHIVKGC
jgi:hypothetical protein